MAYHTPGLYIKENYILNTWRCFHTSYSLHDRLDFEKKDFSSYFTILSYVKIRPPPTSLWPHPHPRDHDYNKVNLKLHYLLVLAYWLMRNLFFYIFLCKNSTPTHIGAHHDPGDHDLSKPEFMQLGNASTQVTACLVSWFLRRKILYLFNCSH